jgi:hypothetical protein
MPSSPRNLLVSQRQIAGDNNYLNLSQARAPMATKINTYRESDHIERALDTA